MLRKTELEKVKQELLRRKVELEEELQSLSSEKIVDGQSQDDGDQVMSVTMESLRNILQDTEYQEYRNIVAALASIDKGTYGICQDCQLPISANRLKYNPNASRCLSCQEKNESKM